ncbi:4Fe-4S dicluster domain-containing protein [uncultured Thiocystis sp.]|jgi:formate hydrogenlyase subunit 6/NADH:ubiquinone oxidoreductase subunit I|uniref:4Fe-4S dicluster domain-containing protein n=1 Tax=uncultured Thiocystis sp. TaxID=1202134 RepID=UPI0025DEA260|nr:4Fe-4S dicluster domain-containing protein [uncultured Thiocystis sp.]
MAWNIDLKGLIQPFSALKFSVKQPYTLNYPVEKRQDVEGYRGFHLNTLSLCVGCGNCQDICMNEAIDMVEAVGEINPKNASGLVPRIDYGRCCWCGLCTDVCGPDSLRLESDCIYASEDAGSFLYMPKDQ